MNYSGTLKKIKNLWISEIPLLDISSQGKTQKEAISMIIDAIELLIHQKNFKVKANIIDKSNFYISSNNEQLLAALLLKRQRQKHHLTLEKVSKKLGYRSINAYAQYEQGKNLPSFSLLNKFLEVISKDSVITLNLSET